MKRLIHWHSMKLGILLSGGKDSVLAAHIAGRYHRLACAITLKSINDESYMFHVPNVDLTELQAKAMDIPLIIQETKGEKEKELVDLKKAIMQAKEEYDIDGIVTGAVASQYQSSRIQTICNDLDLHVFNPLWQMDQIELLETVLKNNMKVIVVGVFAYPFQESWLGRELDQAAIDMLKSLQEKYDINPAGEGGEIETLVLDCPLFYKKIEVEEKQVEYDNYAGTFHITKANLVSKEKDDTFYVRKVMNHKQPDVTIINTVNDPLHQFEFIRPITDILEKEGYTFNISPINNPKLLGEKIIFTGTSLKDNAYLDYKEVARQINSSNKPILAICAGMQLLVEEYLENIEEIGPIFTESTMFPKYNYYLHQYGITQVSDEWEVVATTEKGIAAIKHKTKPVLGVQFHPEVSSKDTIKEFLEE